MTNQKNSIRAWALATVALTSMFLMGMAVWFTLLLARKDWCDIALGAERNATDEGRIAGSDACFSLMRDQISAIAWNSHIGQITFALCLLALVVIVLAGGRLSFSASKDGISGNISKDGKDPVQAAHDVADAAEARAEEIEDELGPRPGDSE